jgi:translocation and assembly module TamB
VKDAGANPEKRQRRFKWVQAAIGLLLLAGVVGLAAYINSDSFREKVRARVEAELERITGGRVEMQSFTWNLSRLHFEARGLTIHGLEGPGEEPYVHADRVSLRLKIVSFLSREITLREVVIDRLAVHLIVAPDGSTNQPAPKGLASSEGLSTQHLFDLAVNRVEINGGTLLLNQEKIPFALAGDRFAMGMSYSRHERGYDGTLAVSVAAASWRNRAPVKGELDLHFVLRPTETEIKSLKAVAGRSTVQASGMVRNYNNLEAGIQYTASLDLLEVARQAEVPQVRAGRADLQGALYYRGGRYTSAGAVSVRGLDWQDPSLPLRASGIDATAGFSLAPDKIAFSRLSARIFDGSVTGDAQVTNWNQSLPAQKSPPQRGTANLHLSRLQIIQIARAVSTARLPIDRLDLAGSAGGEVKINWSGPAKNAVAEMVIDVDPPAHPSARAVPLTAHMRATYHGDIRTLEFASLTMATRAIHLNANGQLGSRKAQAHLAVNATDLHELQPALDALRPGTRIPLTVNGHASFSGYVFGDLDALAARGQVELEDFATEVAFTGEAADSTEPAGAAIEPTPVHWDSLSAEINYSPSGLSLQRGLLRRGRAKVAFTAGTSLHGGMFDERASQLAVDLRLENAGVTEIQELLGLNYPLAGTVNADLHATGTALNLRGGGNLQVFGLAAYGETFRNLRSQVQIAGREVQLRNISLAHNGAQLSGSIAYDLGSRHYRFDLTGSSISLATLTSLQSQRFAVAGKAGFHAAGSGGGDAFVINGQLGVANLVINQQAVGDLNATLETRGQDLQVRASSALPDSALNLDGTVRLQGDFPAQMTVQFSQFDLNPLLRAYLQDQVTGRSSISGSVDIHGPVKRPRELSISGNVNQLFASLENIKLLNQGPIHVAVDRETLRADQFHLVGEDTDLFVQGAVQLSGDQTLDVHTRGRFNLKMAQGFNPNILAYGPASFTIDVAGNLAHPRTSGRIELSDAGVSLRDLPNGLSHINGAMVFAEDRVQIEKLTANSGGGELNVGGFLAYRNGFYFDLTATGKDVRLRYPPGVSASADASLHYSGSAKSSLLSGDVTVTRFGMNPRFDFGTFLTQTKGPTGPATLNPYLDNLRLDVHITSTPALRVETSLAKVSGDVDLRVRGTAARPSVLGRVTIAEGDVFFNGTKYRLERGDITFNNPLVIEPVVNVEMSARVQNYDVTVGLHGSLAGGSGLRLTYRSDPPLSSSDIISLLAFGRPRGQDVYNAAQPGQSSSSDASNVILGQALDAAVNDRVEKLFGASRVKVDPQFVGQQNNSVARVTIEQTINNNITLTYVTNLTQSSQTVVQVEYNVDKNVSIVAVRDQYGVLGFDVHIRRHKK